MAGGLASLPYILAAGHPPISAALSAAVCLVSCTLFGVTFRYAIRQDLQNLQLKVLVCRRAYHMQLHVLPSKLKASLVTDQIMSAACSILGSHAFPRVFVRGLHAHHRLHICVCLRTQAHHAPALADAALSKVLWSQGIVLNKFGLGYLMLLSIAVLQSCKWCRVVWWQHSDWSVGAHRLTCCSSLLATLSHLSS